MSYAREVIPILRANCVGCHRPGKTKGGLDLESLGTLRRGGKSGPALVHGQPEKSLLLGQISGPEPEMPKDGEPLTTAEVEVVRRWIAQGATDDSTGVGPVSERPTTPPVYRALPAISALAWSPVGNRLAVSGWHEVLIHDVGSTQIVARLIGDSPRIESLAFSPDGQRLAVSGGSPSDFGEVQVWDLGENRLLRSIKATQDSLFGVAWSPDGSRLAVGGTDKLVRVFAVADGREVMRCDNHIDWVLGTAFTRDGSRLVSVGKDKSLKLIDVATGRLIDDVNRPNEVLLGLAASPKENLVVSGSETGGLRLYRMEPRGGRLAEGDDKENSYVREFDRLPGAVQALAFSPDGMQVAATGPAGETRVFRVNDGRRMATIKSTNGPVFAVTFSADGSQVATGGADGRIRVYEAGRGGLVREWGGVGVSSER